MHVSVEAPAPLSDRSEKELSLYYHEHCLTHRRRKRGGGGEGATRPPKFQVGGDQIVHHGPGKDVCIIFLGILSSATAN